MPNFDPDVLVYLKASNVRLISESFSPLISFSCANDKRKHSTIVDFPLPRPPITALYEGLNFNSNGLTLIRDAYLANKWIESIAQAKFAEYLADYHFCE